MEILLASQSPRRRELMALVTPDFTTGVADFDEGAIAAHSPAELALLLAEGKAAAAFGAGGHGVVIGCDTVVEMDGEVLGKPAGRAEARAMLQRLSGGVHLVHTGVCVRTPEGIRHSFVESTRVRFARIPDAAINAYVETDEPYDKAGGYGIQGWAAKYTTRIEGCYYNVMGLPVAALYAALQQLGVLQ